MHLVLRKKILRFSSGCLLHVKDSNPGITVSMQKIFRKICKTMFCAKSEKIKEVVSSLGVIEEKLGVVNLPFLAQNRMYI